MKTLKQGFESRVKLLIIHITRGKIENTSKYILFYNYTHIRIYLLHTRFLIIIKNYWRQTIQIVPIIKTQLNSSSFLDLF